VTDPIPFVVGVGRSGTTLLRLLLDAHPSLAIPAETSWCGPLSRLPPSDEDRLRRSFLDLVTQFPTFVDVGLSVSSVAKVIEAASPFTIGEGLRRIGQLDAASRSKTRWGDKSPGHTASLQAVRALLPESPSGRSPRRGVAPARLEPAEAARIEAVAGDLLVALGYPI
jgi:hypothetical protein